MYSKMPTKPKICIFFQFGLPTIVSFLVLQSSLEEGRESRLLYYYNCLTFCVLLLFLAVPYVGLQCVIVVCPDLTHLFKHATHKESIVPLMPVAQ